MNALHSKEINIDDNSNRSTHIYLNNLNNVITLKKDK